MTEGLTLYPIIRDHLGHLLSRTLIITLTQAIMPSFERELSHLLALTLRNHTLHPIILDSGNLRGRFGSVVIILKLCLSHALITQLDCKIMRTAGLS